MPMGEILARLREDLVDTLGENLVCLLYTGSRVRGEATEESDFDVFLLVKSIDSSVIEKMREVFLGYPTFSTYLVSEHEFETLPGAQLLQLRYSETLYGDIEYEEPAREEVRNYISRMRRDWLDRVRHYLIIPHVQEKLAKNVHFALKRVYLYLSYTVFLETSKLPKTRREVKAYFKERKGQDLGIRLLEILDNWHSYRKEVAKNPTSYLFLLEEFFRQSRP